ncbi:hypothetical protein [Streptomyces sp. NBC_01465]|uniref:hypothetical protein n=1 Tax=Streptomyces sp. NBC_01465 TaxID=2903878 RepID=UPI002E34E516|nr:hypothetical protein [Streptomyces sp. NBC_01465]
MASHQPPDLPNLPQNAALLASRHALRIAYGVPVLAREGIAAAVALGTSTLLVRLPTLPPHLRTGQPSPPLTEHGWLSVDPWQSGLPTAEGISQLSGVLGQALARVAYLDT